MDDYKFLYLLLLIPILIAYRNTGGEQPPIWEYESNAISITCQADERLNLYNGRPHTLTFVVYQLTDGGPFQNSIKRPAGVRTLLEQTVFDPSVVAIDTRYIQPGETQTITLSRVEGARWIGIAAGYYSMEPGAVSCLIQIPTERKTTGWVRKQTTVKPSHLYLTLGLGPLNIIKADSNNGTH
jgi:type VI secretion system VasD/TssJ family lipoprotein